MIVNWKEQRMKVIPVNSGDVENVVLFPGYNTIKDELVELIRPSIALDIKLKRIVLAEKKTEEGVAVPVPVTVIPLAKLKSMVLETNNIDTLREWLATEKRQAAQAVIQARVTEIEAELKAGGRDAGKPSDGDDDDSAFIGGDEDDDSDGDGADGEE
jgi:hypothetical protein